MAWLLPRGSPLDKEKTPLGAWERHAEGSVPKGKSSSQAYQRTVSNCPISIRSLKMNIHKIR